MKNKKLFGIMGGKNIDDAYKLLEEFLNNNRDKLSRVDEGANN